MITSIGSACLSAFRAIPDTFVLADTETTGLFTDDGEAPGIVSLGACLVIDGCVVDRLSLNANPGRPMDPEATRVNGITDSIAASFSPLKEVWPEFKAYLDGSFVVAHNMEFDWGVIMQNASRHELEIPDPDALFCSMNASHLYGRIVLNCGPFGPSLKRLTEHLGTVDGRAQIDDRHDAGVDAEQLAHAIIKLKRLAG
jgi:DNA polymerase III epsilon subunit-like protein